MCFATAACVGAFYFILIVFEYVKSNFEHLRGCFSVMIMMFSSFLLRSGLDGITLMTVKTVTGTEGIADPHAASTPHNPNTYACTHTHTQ